MIDPFTAFAAAQAAVAGIKKAVQLGKDVNGLIGDFGKFFDAKDALQKAANDLGKKGKSDTAQAIEIVMQAEQLRAAEEELKNILVYGYGQSGLWEQMLIERSKLRQAREKRERQERIAIAKRKQMWMEIGAYVLLAFMFLGAGVLAVFILMNF